MRAVLLCAALFGCTPIVATPSAPQAPEKLIFVPSPRVVLPERKPELTPEDDADIERLHLEIGKANAALKQLHNSDHRPEAGP